MTEATCSEPCLTCGILADRTRGEADDEPGCGNCSRPFHSGLHLGYTGSAAYHYDCAREVYGDQFAGEADLRAERDWRAIAERQRGQEGDLRARIEALADLGVREQWPPDEWRAALVCEVRGALATDPEAARDEAVTEATAETCPAHSTDPMIQAVRQNRVNLGLPPQDCTCPPAEATVAEYRAAVEKVWALRLDEELAALQSFVWVETRHEPTRRSVAELRGRLRAALAGLPTGQEGGQ